MKWLFDLYDWFHGYHTAVLEDIQLTWSGAGNQWFTVRYPNGKSKRYAAWIDHSKWPKRGQQIRFTVHKRNSHPGFGLLEIKVIEQ